MFTDFGTADFDYEHETIRFLVQGYERCENTGNLHAQSYIQFYEPRSLRSAIDFIGSGTHVQIAKGSPHENFEYCTKDQQWFESGIMSSGHGDRTDLKEVLEYKTIDEVREHCPLQFIKFHNGLEKYFTKPISNRTIFSKILWLWGSSGSGKTYHATQIGETYYMKDSTYWWNGYTGQTTIILDDFDKDNHYFKTQRDFLKLLDRYPLSVQVKCGYVNINSENIVITSEYPPTHFFFDSMLTQVMRRINESGGGIFNLDEK